jgi:2-iminobutanoate/2-iminopropanoate deaminase
MRLTTPSQFAISQRTLSVNLAGFLVCEGGNVKEAILTDRGPKPIGPYSQAVKANGFIFVSGQIAFDPSTGQIVEGNVAKQTERVLENLRAILEAAGSSLDKAVKTTVFLTDMTEFAEMNQVYSRYLSSNPPARSTVEVAGLPRDVKVEIEVVALA